jgi:hypothetical protein
MSLKNPLFFRNTWFLRFFAVILATVSVLAATACDSTNVTETVVAQDAVANETKDKIAEFDHSAYEALLKKHVDDKGKVDYDGFAKDRAALDTYLESVAKANPSALTSQDERNAFHINAYNAYTIRAVLDDVIGKTDSVKKVDGFWDKKKYRLAGEDLTLDKIEKVSRDFKDPRIHFAYNCASLGCPRLQQFAFTGPKLQEQFEFITKDFLRDEERGLKIDRVKNKIWISRLFSWYAGDFTGDTSKVGFVKGFIKSKFTASAGTNFIMEKGPEEIVQYIKDKKPDVGYLEYDWTLNSQIPPKTK